MTGQAQKGPFECLYAGHLNAPVLASVFKKNGVAMTPVGVAMGLAMTPVGVAVTPVGVAMTPVEVAMTPVRVTMTPVGGGHCSKGHDSCWGGLQV